MFALEFLGLFALCSSLNGGLQSSRNRFAVCILHGNIEMLIFDDLEKVPSYYIPMKIKIILSILPNTLALPSLLVYCTTFIIGILLHRRDQSCRKNHSTIL